MSRKPREIILRPVTDRLCQRSLPSHLRVLVCAVALLSGCFAAERVGPPVLPTLPDEATAAPHAERWIHVRKGARVLTLYDGSEVVATYPIVLGKDPDAAKLYEGDRRTPEGEYHVVAKYFHPYWERFLLLDYPAPFNRAIYTWSRKRGLIPARGRRVPGPGGAIGIHGAENERLNRGGIDWTQGCISLLNRDVAALYDSTPVGTRVVIEP